MLAPELELPFSAPTLHNRTTEPLLASTSASVASIRSPLSGRMVAPLSEGFAPA